MNVNPIKPANGLWGLWPFKVVEVKLSFFAPVGFPNSTRKMEIQIPLELVDNKKSPAIFLHHLNRDVEWPQSYFKLSSMFSHCFICLLWKHSSRNFSQVTFKRQEENNNEVYAINIDNINLQRWQHRWWMTSLQMLLC